MLCHNNSVPRQSNNPSPLQNLAADNDVHSEYGWTIREKPQYKAVPWPLQQAQWPHSGRELHLFIADTPISLIRSGF